MRNYSRSTSRPCAPHLRWPVTFAGARDTCETMVNGGLRRLALLAVLAASSLLAQTRPDPLAVARAMAPSTAPAAGRPMVITDGRTGRPLAGASLILLERDGQSLEVWDEIMRIRAAFPDDPPMAALSVATRFGHKLVTDERGRAVIADDFRGTVHIVAGDLHDHTAVVESYESEVSVYGRRQVTVELQFTDGSPAPDVGVELRHVGHVMHDDCGSMCQARTDARGRARIELPPFTMREFWTGALVLQAMVCGDDARSCVAVDPKRYRAGDPGPVKLRLPLLGRLRITARDGAGAERAFGSLSVLAEDGREQVRVSTLGAARTEFLVAPGRTYHIYANFPHQIGGRELVIAGPKTTGDVVTAEFDVRREPLTLTVRLQHGGRPVDSGHVDCHELNFLGQPGVALPDPEGRVWIALSPDQIPLGKVTLSARRFDPRTSPATALGAVALSLPAGTNASSTGVLDLGVAVLQEEPILLAGRVVDERGRPVAGAYVQRRVANAPLDLPVAVRTDANGRFALRMLNPFPEWAIALRNHPAAVPKRIWLWVSHPDAGCWPPNSVGLGPDVEGFEVGATVEIVLQR